MPRFGAAACVVQDGETLELQEARVKQRYTEGMTLLTQGRKVEAQDCFQRTLEDVAFERDIIGNARFSALRKVRGLCFKMLGQIAQEHGDKDAALHRWGNALAMDDKDVVMWHNLGCLAHELSRLNVARCAFERGLELRPNNPLFLDKLCEVTYHIGDFGACRSACELLLALAPAHPRGLVYKGLLLCMQPATESQGLGLLEDAQEAAGAMSVHDVAQLRDLERKRPRLEPAPQDPPHAIALCKPDLRCLLDKLLELLPARADEPEAPTPALAVRPSSMHHNHLCVVSLDESRPAQLEAGTSRNAGRNEGTQAVATLNVDDNATRDADMGVLDGEDVAAAVVYEDKDALCMVCGGDVDPGDFPGDDLLLCENFERCGQSYHTTCLCPAIKEPPGDDEQWFCPKCDPRPPAESPGISVATQEVAPAFSSLPASENSVGSATGASGDGGDEASPGKRSGARRSRTSNVVVTAAPSRKSKRQSQADTDKRPPLVVQLSRILDLVSETGSEDVAEEEDIPPSPRPAPEAAATAPKCWECQGETLSRYEMLWKLGSATCTHEKIIAQLLEKLKLRPTCLLEVVHKLVHLLAASACTVRLRGKVLDAALDLDAAVRQRLTYAPEASLFFAELNLDRYEARLKDSAREYAEQEAEGNDEPSSSQDVALIDENSCDALLAELPKSKAAWTQRYLAAFNFHIKGLWCERFEGWREQARYLWLLSNHATCHREPWNVLEPLHRCRAVMEAAHADAEAACIYLPSCQLNNHITVKGIEKRLLGPQQEVRDMMLDQQARELDLAMTEAREQLQLKQGMDDESEARQLVNDVAERTVKTLAPHLINDAEQNDWLVTTLPSADQDSWRRMEKHLHQLRNACSELAAYFKQEVYILNVMLAEVVRLRNVTAERRVDSLYAPLHPRLFCKVEGAAWMGVDSTLHIVSQMVDREGHAFAEVCKRDEHVPKMLQQMELQLARLTCKLGCSKEHVQLFHRALLLFWKTYDKLRPELQFERKFAVLHIMFEELLRRNVHGHRSNAFFRIYLSVLHEQRRKLQEQKAGTEAAADTAATNVRPHVHSSDASMQDANDDPARETLSALIAAPGASVPGEDEDSDDDSEMHGLMQELAKCYYAMYGFKVRAFRSEYDWVDNLIRSASEEGAEGEARRCSKAREGDIKGKMNETLALDLWSFVQPLAQREGGKFVDASPAELKDILKAILEVIKPDNKLFVHQDEITKYLSCDLRSLPSMSDLLPDFSAVLARTKTAPALALLPDVGEGPKAKRAQDKIECVQSIFFLLAECILLGSEEHIDEKISFHCLDLYMNPGRKESWIGLADSYDEKLQTSSSCGIRSMTLLEHSPEAQRVLCNSLQAYSAVLTVAQGDAAATQDAHKRLGVALYLLLQGTRSSKLPFEPQWCATTCARAYEELSQASDPFDWTVEYYLGKFARKRSFYTANDEERRERDIESLAHFYRAAVQNVDDDASTLCIEPLYKLHSTRAKIILREGFDPSLKLCDSILDVLDNYSLTRSMQRAKTEVQDSKVWEKCNIDVTKFLEKSEKDQAQFELAVHLSADDDSLSTWQVLRDCMLAMRVAILKNRNFSSSKTRYRLAWMMDQCCRTGSKFVDADKTEVRVAVSVHIVELLIPLFFNTDKTEVHTPTNMEKRLSNYYMSGDQIQVASFNTLNSFLRIKMKLIKLFVSHLHTSARDDPLALDRLEKMLEFMIKEEKRSHSESDKASVNIRSIRPAILHTVQILYDAAQDKALTAADNKEAAEFAFRAAGKLRTVLQDHIGDLFNYFEVRVDDRLRNAPSDFPSRFITLQDKHCPLNMLLRKACETYCASTKTSYYETTAENVGPACMGCAMSRWKEIFRPKKLSVQSGKTAFSAPLAPRVPEAQRGEGRGAQEGAGRASLEAEAEAMRVEQELQTSIDTANAPDNSTQTRYSQAQIPDS